MDKEQFHNKHEHFTNIAYNTTNILPDRYVFILTNLCNLNCGFCFQKKDFRKDSMKLQDWINLTEQLPEYARVTLTGGEPFIFPDFNKLFSYIAERFDCNIITNGVLLTEEKIDFLLAYPKFRVLSISIDNVNNTLRDVKPEQWQHVEKMMKYFVKKRNEINPSCILDAKTMILDENAKDLLEIHKYCVEELGCDNHSFQFLKGSPIQHADYMFEFEDILKKSRAVKYKNFDTIKEQLELVRQYNIRTGKVAYLHPKIADLVSNKKLPNINYINEVYHIKENFLPCKFPWSSVHINVDGVLFPCLAISMGNAKKTPLREIINNEIFDKFRGLIRKEGTIEACNRCGWLRPN